MSNWLHVTVCFISIRFILYVSTVLKMLEFKFKLARNLAVQKIHVGLLDVLENAFLTSAIVPPNVRAVSPTLTFQFQLISMRLIALFSFIKKQKKRIVIIVITITIICLFTSRRFK